MRTIFVLAAVLCFGALGAGIALGVTGGQPDTVHTYVGVIAQQQAQGSPPVTGTEYCTGFLYDGTGSRLATAAHCFPDGSTVYVSFLQSPPKPVFDADGVTTTPGWIPAIVHDDSAYCATCGQAGGPTNDVAVVHLSVPRPQQGTAQLPPAGSDATLPNGDPIDVVGYGVQAVSKKTGVTACCSRQSTTTALKNVTPYYLKLLADPGACEGDSGGPDLQHGTNLALAINTFSNGNPNCNGVTYSVRLDDPAIQAFLAAG